VSEEEVREVYGGEETLKLMTCILHGKKPYIYSATETRLLGKRLPEKFWWRRWMAICGGERCTVWSGSRERVRSAWNANQRRLMKERREERRLEAERNRTAWQTLKELVRGALHFTK
jgi:hypothetical protein